MCSPPYAVLETKGSCVNASVRLDHREQCNDQSLKLGVVVVRASRIETSEQGSRYFTNIITRAESYLVYQSTNPSTKRNNGSDPNPLARPQRTSLKHKLNSTYGWLLLANSAKTPETRTRASMPRRFSTIFIPLFARIRKWCVKSAVRDLLNVFY